MRTFVLLALLFAASFLRWHSRLAYLEWVRKVHKGYVSLSCSVASDVFYFTNFVDVDCGGYKARLFFKGDIPQVVYGDLLSFSGVAFVPYNYKNPGSFDLADFMNRKNIAFFVKVKKYRVVRRGRGLFALFHRLRLKFVHFACRLDEPLRGFVGAVVLGEKGMFKEHSRTLYRLGLGHILAVSGLHMGAFIFVLYGLWLWVLRVINLFWQFPYLFLPRRSAHIPVVMLLPLLIVVTGGHLSALRAAVMYVVYVVFGVFMERETPLLSLLLVALALFLLVDPGQMESAGFQYTFLAVLVIGLLLGRFSQAPSWLKGTLLSLTLPLVLMPVAAYHFHRIYPLGFLFNALLLPVFAMLIALLFPLFFAAYILGGLFLWGLRILNYPLGTLLGVVDLFARLPGLEVIVGRVGFWGVVLLSLSVMWVILRGRLLGFLVVLALCMFLFVFRDGKRNRVIFFDMGRSGEAALVVCEGEKILINAEGKGREGFAALRQALEWEGVGRLDRVLCLLKRQRYLGAVVSHFRVDELEGCKREWEGSCRSASVCGVDFVCRPEDCSKGLCRVLKGAVIAKGERFYPYKEGALKFYLGGWDEESP